MAKISTMMQSDLDIADSISEFETSDAYRNAKYAPSEPVLPLQSGEDLYVHESVAACRYSRLPAFPVPGAKTVRAHKDDTSLWGKAAKIIVELAIGERRNHFLKVVVLGDLGKRMCEGEFESLKAVHAVFPGFVPEPYV
ncbi:hypothetical protein MMC21_007816 [Puttea exsequens]|nr:hypothetical protein [Puttea exsequens]